MKHLIVAFLLIISILTAGCGGGGGDSSKPTTIVTAPTISNVTTESASTYTVATISGAGFGLPVSSSYVTYSGQTYKMPPPGTTRQFWLQCHLTRSIPLLSGLWSTMSLLMLH